MVSRLVDEGAEAVMLQFLDEGGIIKSGSNSSRGDGLDSGQLHLSSLQGHDRPRQRLVATALLGNNLLPHPP